MKITCQASEFNGETDLDIEPLNLIISIFSNEESISKLLKKFFGNKDVDLVITRYENRWEVAHFLYDDTIDICRGFDLWAEYNVKMKQK